MEAVQDVATASPEVVVTSSTDIFSPGGGKSRYGRTRRPKVTRDFCNIDDVVMDERPPTPKVKSPVKGAVIHRELVFEDEFTKLDDLGMRVANNFKANLQRGMDGTIKERKFFKTLPENKVDVSSVVDVTKVLKLISKPTVVAEICEVRNTPKTALKTYSNKRKHVHDSEHFIVESFGLPDEPIIPVNSPLVVERDTKIDVDMTAKIDVNLANPWAVEDLDPVPLYASEPVSTMDEFNFRGGMLHLLSYDSLLSENTDLLEAATSQDNTNFEKSRIPTEVEARECNQALFEDVCDLFNADTKQSKDKVAPSDEFQDVDDLFSAEIVPPKKPAKKLSKILDAVPPRKAETVEKKLRTSSDAPQKVIGSKDQKVVKNNKIDIPGKLRSPVKSPEARRSRRQLQNEDNTESNLSVSEVKKVKKEVSKVIKTVSSPVRKPVEDCTKRILRSSFDNNNTEFKKIEETPPVIEEVKVIKKSEKGNTAELKKIEDSHVVSEEAKDVRKSKTGNNTQSKKTEDSPLVDKEIKVLKNVKKLEKGNKTTEFKKIEDCNVLTEKVKIVKDVKKPEKGICSPQCRVVLNPLSYTQRHLKYANQVPNPFHHDKKAPANPEKKSGSDKVPNPFSTGKKERHNGERKRGRPRKRRQFPEKKADAEKQPPEEVQIKEEEADVSIVKKEIIEFQLGDLAWAKIGTHPYWPCMITKEPVSGDYKKPVFNRSLPLYHVRFFGDKGRRSWVAAQYVMFFFGRDDLAKLAKEAKPEDRIMPSTKKMPKWESGVEEAESLKNKSVQDRFKHFFDMFATEREKKKLQQVKISGEVLINATIGKIPVVNKKRRRTSDGVGWNKRMKVDGEGTKSQIVVERRTSEKKMKVDGNESKSQIVAERRRTSDSVALNKKMKADGEETKSSIVAERRRTSDSVASNKKMKADGEETKSPIVAETRATSDSVALNKKTKRDGDETKSQINAIEEGLDDVIKKEEVEEETKVKKTVDKPIEKITLPPRSSPRNTSLPKKPAEFPTQDTLQPRRKSLRPEEFTDESIEARKKLRNFGSASETPEHNLETPELVQETPEISKDAPQIPSSSDTDSKFSDNSSVPTSLESQAALFRRNNIFRGIPREKVCQVCEEGGEVFKCKGPCNGVYHQTCATKKVEDKPAAEEAKDEEAEENKVEIISVASNKPLPDLSQSPNFKGMSLAEKIDFRMKEIMKKLDYQTVYDSTDSGSEECLAEDTFEKAKSESKLSLKVTDKPSKKEVPIIKHVTADNISYICVTDEKPKDKDVSDVIREGLKNSKCSWCATNETPPCLICHSEGSKFRQKCSLHQCGKYYHSECVKSWPQTQWSVIQSTKDNEQYDTFACPRHVCHTCISDDPRAANSRCSSDKVVKCLRCPATYHSSNYCVPAGTLILSGWQIVCPRHFTQATVKKKKFQQTINTNWCFICSKGGNLICCETCPTSVHVECLPGDLNADDTFFCEDCQSGRLPLYDEIVWVKLGSFRWWPALILFPNEIPDNVRNMVHNKGEFVVKFYGTYDHYWVGRGRTFLFQEGDKGHSKASKKKVDHAFIKAIEEAAAAHELKKQFRSKVAEKNSGLKPPPYIRIKVNKPVGNVRLFDGNTSNTTSCDCDPNQPHPCGPDSDCLNRLLLTECNPEVCPAGERCNNQCFEKREYPPLIPHRTQVRGWGLKTLAPIRKGQFVIEYVGEIIDEQEYQRRVQKMHEQKEENYYFLTIDKDRTLDAGPKGNVARFMNHSCQPNCETQKWTVNGDTRVGLFAKCDIPADTELTFNYNLECIGKEKKICKCGAPNCSGFIGVKVKQDGAPKKPTKPKKKKTPPPVTEVVDNDNPCFMCDKVGDVRACNNKICTKYYHLGCVALKSWPEGGKWVCPWHNCNVCSKRTIRCCVKCVNSYCPPHSEGYVRHDKTLGFVCFEHDPAKVPEEVSTVDDDSDDLDLMSLSMRLNGVVTSTPLKKPKTRITRLSVANMKKDFKKTQKKEVKRKSATKVGVRSHVRNTADLFQSTQKEVKLRKFTPVRHLRSNRSTKRVELNRTNPERELPIRKRYRLRCQNNTL